ncbi:MAG TPA: VPLPA-CTERM sorting domain-containing protein [Spongiibacteraceae bacterium]|nr:VPLPA-CTERM sorting domain-containing protein [Spongiibacteraceae bacterium]
MKFPKALLAAALISGMAGAASATTYNFSNNGTVFTVDGIKLTVTTPTGTVFNTAGSGLGVRRSGIEDTSMNSDLINEGKDILLFTFDHAIKLTNMSVTAWQNGSSLDQADLTYNGVTTRLPNSGPNFTFSNPIYVTSFTLTAKGGGTAFRVSSLGVAAQPAPPAVPVPAAAWLMGSGLVGLAGMARRRNIRSA